MARPAKPPHTIIALVFVACLALALAWPVLQARDSRRSVTVLPPLPAASGHSIPLGPRYVIASGRFGGSNWGDYDDEQWRFVIWGDETTSCHRFEVGEPTGFQGVSCSSLPRRGLGGEHIGARTYDPGGGQVLSITYGQVSVEVADLEFRLSNGEVIGVDPIEPSPEVEVPINYYLAFLPATDSGTIVALDESGHVLDRTNLCHERCLGSY